jgi:hypothetical protein
LNYSCGVSIVTELAKGHQLVHAHKLAMKTLSEFSFPMTSTGYVYDNFFILDTFYLDTVFFHFLVLIVQVKLLISVDPSNIYFIIAEGCDL